MECKCSVPGRIIHRNSVKGHTAEINPAALIKDELFGEESNWSFPAEHFIAVSEDSWGWRWVFVLLLGNFKIFSFVCVSNVSSNAVMKSVWTKWHSRNSLIWVLIISSGNTPPLCLQTRQTSSRLSSELSKIEFVLPHEHDAWLLLLPGSHVAAASCGLPSRTTYFVYVLDPTVSPRWRHCITELAHLNPWWALKTSKQERMWFYVSPSGLDCFQDPKSASLL